MKVRKIPIVAIYCEFIATFRFKLTRTSENRCQSDSEQNRKGKREICGCNLEICRTIHLYGYWFTAGGVKLHLWQYTVALTAYANSFVFTLNRKSR